MTELPRSIREAAELLRTRKASAVELADLALARSHADSHNAWLHLSDDHAGAQARAAKDPSNTDSQRAVAFSDDNIGDVLNAKGDLDLTKDAGRKRLGDMIAILAASPAFQYR